MQRGHRAGAGRGDPAGPLFGPSVCPECGPGPQRGPRRFGLWPPLLPHGRDVSGRVSWVVV